MSLARRIAAAVSLGIAAAVLSYVGLTTRGYLASDFEWPLRAAQALMAGQNPYQVIVGGGPYPFDTPFYYPLPAALAALPFADLDSYLAGALFFGVSSGALAFGLSSGPSWRIIMFVSPSFLVAAEVAQWSPLMVAAAVVPALQGLAICKPTIGIASFLYRPTRTGVLTGAAFVLISLAILPIWPISWLMTTLTSVVPHPAPLTVLPGFVLALSFLAWRSREGRLLAAMSILPQLLFWYDQLILFLIPRTARQMIAYVVINWVGYAGWYLTASYLHVRGNMYGVVDLATSFVMATMYLPALGLVLAHLLEDRRTGNGQVLPHFTLPRIRSLPQLLTLIASRRHRADF